MKKIILNSQLSILNLLLFCTVLSAQSNHEFSVYLGGGLSTLNYSVTTGEQKMGFGGHIGLGYTFFFSPNWGLGTGVEFALYNSKFNLNNLTTNYTLTDPTAAPGQGQFDFISKLGNYEEKQSAGLLQIPLMLQFQTDGNHKFYAAAGGKIGLPISASYKVDNATLENSGFYSYESYTYTTQIFRGFGSNQRSYKDDLSFKTAFFASVEAGMKWRLSDNLSLYTGAYFDYGFNNIRKDGQAKQFVEYSTTDDPRDFKVHSVTYAQYTESGKAPRAFTDKVSPLAAGIKLRLAFGGGKKTAPTPTPRPIVDDSERLAREAAERAEAERLAREAAERAAAEKAAAEKAAVEKAAAERAEAERLAREKAAARKAITDELLMPVDNYPLSQITLTGKQKQELDKRIALLQENPDMLIFIYGHTCEIGGDKVNERVGLERAEKVKAYLISKGIDAKRITGTASKLDREPVAPNTNEPNRKQNRRVEITVVN